VAAAPVGFHPFRVLFHGHFRKCAFECLLRLWPSLRASAPFGHAFDQALDVALQPIVTRIGDELVEINWIMAPTFLAMLHSLSFKIPIKRRVVWEMLLRASKEMPLVKAASPKMQTTFSLDPR